MLWFTLWFMVILKIPLLYLAWVIWWAVKDPPPEAYAGPTGSELGSGGGGRGWRPTFDRRRRGRRGGPHGSPRRRAARVPLGRNRARAS